MKKKTRFAHSALMVSVGFVAAICLGCADIKAPCGYGVQSPPVVPQPGFYDTAPLICEEPVSIQDEGAGISLSGLVPCARYAADKIQSLCQNAKAANGQCVYYPDIPLDISTQEQLWSACEETGCPYELALSVIYTETRYQNIIGDNGNSIGYMQIQPRWHKARMERLGVTDLSDPLSNFRVGCDLLAELIAKYGVEEALTCYNTGSPGESKYADMVLSYYSGQFQ